MPMSTSPAVQPQVVRGPEGPREIMIVSHSNLFYWWPVWAVGFLMALITFFDGHRMSIVPEGTEAYHAASVTAKVGDTTKTLDNRDALILPKDKKLPDKPGVASPEDP